MSCPQQCQRVQVMFAESMADLRFRRWMTTDSVASAVSFEEGFERDLGPPTAATLVEEVEPTHQARVADFSPVSRVSSFEVPTIRMDVDDSPSHSLVGALEQDLMSSRRTWVHWIVARSGWGVRQWRSSRRGSCGDVRRSSGNSVVTHRSPRGFETVGQDQFGDDFLQESSGDEDSASFFERALQECNAHRHDRGHVW